MLLLTSGRIIDLVTDRAKYHALENNGPQPDVEHKALYALVDIVYRHRDDNGNPKRGWTEFDFDFSGYTLADIPKAMDWSDAEKAELYLWITRDVQKQRIETARRRLVDNQQQLTRETYSAPEKLFSTLQNRIKALPLNYASAGQWLATISNMQQLGIRREEFIWSGLYVFLSKQDETNRLSKSEVLAAINFAQTRLVLTTEQIWGTNGGLSFKETAQKMPHQAVYRAALKLDETCHCILRYVDETCNYRVGVVKTLSNGHDMALNTCWFALDPYGRAIVNRLNQSLFFNDSSEAIKSADQHARDEFGLKNGAKYHTHYDHLTLYGGDDYREWQVSLPDYQRVFFGAHYIDHNVLIHIRTTSRLDKFGNKILFIEEVQSDWHQTGGKNGYDTSYWGTVANAPFKKEWPVLAVKLLLVQACLNGYDGIAWPDGKIQENRYGKTLKTIKRYYDLEIPKALNRLGKKLNCRVKRTKIETRDPWLNLVKSNDKWSVSDGLGKFKTREKYGSREEAMMVVNRHSKSIDLPVSAYFINEPLRCQIVEQGLPLFGEAYI